MLCTFFGHRDTPDSIRIPLTAVLEYLIQNTGVQEFYVGNQGNFDRLVYQALENLKPVYSQITYHVVLPYLPQKKQEPSFYSPERTLFPEELEQVPPRYAISRRNRWMVQKADFVVCYLSRNYGGAAQFVRYAGKKGKHIINLQSWSRT